MLSPNQRLRALILSKYPPGSEWLEALISTGKRYAVPRLTGGADLWDGAVTVKSLAMALQKCERLRQAYAEMSGPEQDAVWSDPDMGPMRRAVRVAVLR